MSKASTALSTKPTSTRKHRDNDEALAAVKKGPLSRLNANVDAAKYKRLQVMALHNNTDITTLVNAWIDAYLGI